MEKDSNLKTAIDVLDQFYNDTALLLETIKGILINDYGYKHFRDNRVCWEGSTSLLHPESWLPASLCLYFRDKNKKDSYLSVLIMLKDCWDDYRKALDKYIIYGCKFDGVKNDNIYLLCKDSINKSRDPNYTCKNCGDYIEVDNEELFQSCKLFEQSLWGIKDVPKAKEFADKLAKL